MQICLLGIKQKVYVLCYFKLKWRKEMFFLTSHSTHFIYGYMASDIYGKGPLR